MSLPKEDFQNHDFKSVKSIRIRFPKIGPGSLYGSTAEFQWKDFCPEVFRRIQELDNIDLEDYALSLCGHETLQEISSLDNNGSLLRLPHDDRFVIKTVCKSKIKVLLAMLPNYCDHIQKYGSTLLTKFYGLHVVRPAGGLKVYFVVMKNILQSDLYIHRRYDLKGSPQGRSPSAIVVDESKTFKDPDLDLSFHLNPFMRQNLIKQIKHDCDFLEAEGVMDYSLLLGMHIEAARGPADKCLTSGLSFPQDSSWRHATSGKLKVEDDQQISYSCSSCSSCDAKLGVRTTARAIPRNLNASVRAPHFNVKLYFGIIDILQGYSVVKRIEHVYKSLHFDPEKISQVKPKAYSTRFQEFISEIFQADDDFLHCNSSPL